MALKVHCAGEPGWFSHTAFRSLRGDLVHSVVPPHFAANGYPVHVKVPGMEKVAAAMDRELTEDEVMGMTSRYRTEL